MIAEVVVNRSNINIDKTFDYVVDTLSHKPV